MGSPRFQRDVLSKPPRSLQAKSQSAVVNGDNGGAVVVGTSPQTMDNNSQSARDNDTGLATNGGHVESPTHLVSHPHYPTALAVRHVDVKAVEPVMPERGPGLVIGQETSPSYQQHEMRNAPLSNIPVANRPSRSRKNSDGYSPETQKPAVSDANLDIRFDY